MTTQLPERLRDLAGEAPRALSPTGLWREGRRRHRRQVVTASALAVCLVVGGAVIGIGSWRSTRPGPAAPPVSRTGAISIPDRLFNPSPWLPATRTPGRLVAFLSSTRDHFPFGSDRSALVGVTAGSQAYRFLELPGQSPDATSAYLSPDGRHLAYWVNGAPTGSAALGDRSVSGFAVLDLTSGVVERHLVASVHGLAPTSLRWVDADRVVLTTDHFTSREPTSYAGRTRAYLCTLGEDAMTVLRHGNALDIPVTSTGGYAAMVGNRRLRSYDARTFDPRPDVTLSAPLKSVGYDVRHGLVAGTEGYAEASGRAAGRLMVGRVTDGRVRLHVVPGGRRYDQALTWVDQSHVATMRQTRSGLVYDVVDVRTGSRRQLTSKPWYGFELAQNALRRATTVPGIAPPRPWNPRWIALGGLLTIAGLLGLLGAAGAARRRRVGP
jgi:hypothetical protein